jgi:alcohol dehydrogenase, propanol-preferring
MRAWRLRSPGTAISRPLELVHEVEPDPGAGQVRVEVTACGVCRTDLHVIEGDLSARRERVIPGHEVVGRVDALGPGCGRLEVGERVGVPWLGATCGVCRYCLRGDENLCEAPRFTGWDDDGGYAGYVLAREDFVYRLPDVFDDVEAAPLLCAGIIGYRALERAALPPGGRLGIYGFGGSAHLTAQVALHRGATVHVLTRSPAARQLALDLGAASAGDAYDRPPEPLDSAILFAPVGALVPTALESLDRGGTLAIAGIHLSDIPSLQYQAHLFQERQIRSVTANTRADGEAFLAVAAEVPVRPVTQRYPVEGAPDALADLAADRVNGAAVLTGFESMRT